MELERKLAKKQGYADPILPDIEATHQSYNKALADVLSQPGTEILAATHNQFSIEFARALWRWGWGGLGWGGVGRAWRRGVGGGGSLWPCFPFNAHVVSIAHHVRAPPYPLQWK